MVNSRRYSAVVIGCSAGGVAALRAIFTCLPADFPAAVMVVNHLHPHADGNHSAASFGRGCRLKIKVADEKEEIRPATIYLAPANYHLLVEHNRCLALSIDDKVNYSRPAIDVLFETAAESYREELVGIVLTGGSQDGAAGLKKISACGGYTIVQDPDSADFPMMPQSALAACRADQVLAPAVIGEFLRDAVSHGALLI